MSCLTGKSSSGKNGEWDKYFFHYNNHNNMTRQTLANRILRELNFARVKFTRARWKGECNILQGQTQAHAISTLGWQLSFCNAGEGSYRAGWSGSSSPSTTCAAARVRDRGLGSLPPSLQDPLTHRTPGQPCLYSSQHSDSLLWEGSKSFITEELGLVLAPSYSITASSGCVLRL